MKKFKLITALLALSFMLTGGIYSQSGGTSATYEYDNALYLSQSTPGQMVPGQSYGVSVTMKNTGRSNWSQGNYSLKLVNVYESMANTWSVSSVDVNSTVSTGNEIVFDFNIIAPMTEGSYNMQWQMANGNAFFGEPSMTVPIRVSGTDTRAVEPNYILNNALFISQDVKSEMETGLTYDVIVTMKNSGSTTWKTGEFKLKVSTKGADNTLDAWEVANVELSDDILAASEVTFKFKVTAPNKSGVYNFQCQLVKDGTFFGQPTTNVVINVN